MHKYERYIIYPLLILALFYGMSGGNVIKTVADSRVFDHLIAKKISIVNDEGTGQIVLTTTSNKKTNEIEKVIKGGVINIYGEVNDNPSVTICSDRDGNGTVFMENKYGELATYIGVTDDSQGRISVYNNQAGRKTLIQGQVVSLQDKKSDHIYLGLGAINNQSIMMINGEAKNPANF